MGKFFASLLSVVRGMPLSNLSSVLRIGFLSVFYSLLLKMKNSLTLQKKKRKGE